MFLSIGPQWCLKQKWLFSFPCWQGSSMGEGAGRGPPGDSQSAETDERSASLSLAGKSFCYVSGRKKGVVWVAPHHRQALTPCETVEVPVRLLLVLAVRGAIQYATGSPQAHQGWADVTKPVASGSASSDSPERWGCWLVLAHSAGPAGSSVCGLGRKKEKEKRQARDSSLGWYFFVTGRHVYLREEQAKREKRHEASVPCSCRKASGPRCRGRAA